MLVEMLGPDLDRSEEIKACKTTAKLLLDAAKNTLKENSHLADGDQCTLKELRDVVKLIDKEWDF